MCSFLLTLYNLPDSHETKSDHINDVVLHFFILCDVRSKFKGEKGCANEAMSRLWREILYDS